MDQDIAELKEIALFRNLTAEKIQKLMDILRRVTFSANEIIMKEDDIGDAMYIILEGTVEVAKSLVIDDADNEEPGRDKVFTRLDGKQRAVFGEIALLVELRRTASVKAVTDCVMYEMKKDDFLKAAEEDCELGYRILLNLGRIVSARLRRADEDTVKLTTAPSIMLREA